MSKSGFDAFGHPVPMERRDAGYRAVKDMIPGVSGEDAYSLVARVAEHIARDKPYEALREATGAPLGRFVSSPQGPYEPVSDVRLDLTGGYRLIATLCTG